MKKLFILLAIVCAGTALSAQKVQESVIDFGKQQVPGYLVNIQNASVDLVESAFKEKLEKEYGLKGTKESGFRAYINQNLKYIGPDNYDIYFTVGEFGKKKNKTTQLTVIVSTGNMNAITTQNNPDVADKIMKFLSDFVSYVQEYSMQQQINALNDQLSKLNNEKSGLEKDQAKNQKQIEKLQKDQEKIAKQLDQNANDIKKVEDQISTIKKQMK
ncbi:MAG: hypothetical protein MJZ57_03340 [Bacteroidales bacterium]|nr:hypothetical protein [Bacteroidales bacterium]